MNKVWIYLVFFTLLSACTQERSSTNTEEDAIVEEILTEEVVAEPINELLNVTAFREKLLSTEGVQLLDIRTPAELEENGTIEGALNLDFYEPNFKAEITNLNRDAVVMLYCRSGGRSGQAAAILKELGFKEVYDLEGGYTAWLESENK